MAKYHGVVGYGITEETVPGVWTQNIIEKEYYGDVIRISRKLDSSQELNDNISVNNQLSIISDPYAVNNFLFIKYATYMGVKWKVSSVDLQYPRLLLTLGGLYNEQ